MFLCSNTDFRSPFTSSMHNHSTLLNKHSPFVQRFRHSVNTPICGLSLNLSPLISFAIVTILSSSIPSQHTTLGGQPTLLWYQFFLLPHFWSYPSLSLHTCFWNISSLSHSISYSLLLPYSTFWFHAVRRYCNSFKWPLNIHSKWSTSRHSLNSS